jgi:hypothetical protein
MNKLNIGPKNKGSEWISKKTRDFYARRNGNIIFDSKDM